MRAGAMSMAAIIQRPDAWMPASKPGSVWRVHRPLLDAVVDEALTEQQCLIINADDYSRALHQRIGLQSGAIL